MGSTACGAGSLVGDARPLLARRGVASQLRSEWLRAYRTWRTFGEGRPGAGARDDDGGDGGGGGGEGEGGGARTTDKEEAQAHVGNGKVAKHKAATVAEDATTALRRAREAMKRELGRTAVAEEALRSSNESLAMANDEFKGHNRLWRRGGQLLNQLQRSRYFETGLVLTGVLIFALAVLRVLSRRLWFPSVGIGGSGNSGNSAVFLPADALADPVPPPASALPRDEL